MPEHTRCIIIDGWNVALKFVDRFSKQLGVRIDMILPRETFERYLKLMAGQNGEIFFCVINDGNRSESSQCTHEENLLLHFQPKELIADDAIVATATMMTEEFPEIPVIVVTQDGPLKHRLQQLGVVTVDSWTFAGLLLEEDEWPCCFDELQQLARSPQRVR